jgi:hypothetical protein
MESRRKAPFMLTRTERIRVGEGTPRVRGGTPAGLSRVGRGLAALFRSRSREIPAEETYARPLRGGGVRWDAKEPRPAMDAGITGGISLLGVGQATPERRGG